MTRQNLDLLIDRYFSGETTEAEESILRSELAATQDGELDDVKAVIGFLAAGKAASRKKARYITAGLSVAAALTLIVSGSFMLREKDTCESWIHGKRITENEVVMRYVQNDMRDILSSSFNASKDLGNIF